MERNKPGLPPQLALARRRLCRTALRELQAGGAAPDALEPHATLRLHWSGARGAGGVDAASAPGAHERAFDGFSDEFMEAANEFMGRLGRAFARTQGIADGRGGRMLADINLRTGATRLQAARALPVVEVDEARTPPVAEPGALLPELADRMGLHGDDARRAASEVATLCADAAHRYALSPELLADTGGADELVLRAWWRAEDGGIGQPEVTLVNRDCVLNGPDVADDAIAEAEESRTLRVEEDLERFIKAGFEDGTPASAALARLALGGRDALPNDSSVEVELRIPLPAHPLPRFQVTRRTKERRWVAAELTSAGGLAADPSLTREGRPARRKPPSP